MFATGFWLPLLLLKCPVLLGSTRLPRAFALISLCPSCGLWPRPPKRGCIFYLSNVAWVRLGFLDPRIHMSLSVLENSYPIPVNHCLYFCVSAQNSFQTFASPPACPLISLLCFPNFLSFFFFIMDPFLGYASQFPNFLFSCKWHLAVDGAFRFNNLLDTIFFPQICFSC